MTDKIQIRTGVQMPPRPRRKSKYEAAHLALAEGPMGEAFEIPLPKEWDPENARLSLVEYASILMEDMRVKFRVHEQSVFVEKETKVSNNGKPKSKGRK